MTTALHHVVDAGDEVTITRRLNAPRELVFAVWTDPVHVTRWGRPQGFTVIECEASDVRPGGSLRLRMQHESGNVYLSTSTYLEVARPERLVYDEVCDENGRRFHQARMTISFAEQGGQTEIRIHAHFTWLPGRGEQWTPELMKQGLADGWKSNLDQLEGYLPGLNPEACNLCPTAEVALEPQEVVITRLISAPRALVYQAWVNPEHLARWWGPLHFTNPVCELDLRPGGRFRIVMRAPDGTDYPMAGLVREVVENERLVMVDLLDEHPAEWHKALESQFDGEGKPSRQIERTVTFEDHGKQTRLTIRTRFGSTADRDAFVRMGMREGWSQSLDKLEGLVQSL